MTVSMSLATVIHLAVLAAPLVGLGWLLHRAWLHRLGLSWRVGTALVFAAVSVFSSGLASVFGYGLWRMLAACGVVILAVVGVWISIGRGRDASVPPSPGLAQPGRLFHLFVFGFFLAPAFVLYLPLDTDAQGFGYLALMVREGGSVRTLAPWQPDVSYLYSPVPLVWWAFLSDLLKLPMHQVMLPFTHIVAGLIGLLGIDLGEALMPGRPRARFLVPLLMAVFGTGLLLRVMDSAYTAVVGLLFTTLFLVLAFQAVRRNGFAIDVLAALALAAAALSSPDAIIILLIGYIPFYATFWLSRSQHRTLPIWARLFLLIPGLGVILTLPWLAGAVPLLLNRSLTAPIGAGFLPPNLGHWQQLILFQGVLAPLLASVGVVIAVQRRSLADVLAVTWLVFVLDFALFGVVHRIGALVGADLLRFVFPHAVGWHGPIIIDAYLASLTIDTLLDWRPIQWPRQLTTVLSVAALMAIVLAVLLQQPLLQASYRLLHFYGSFSSRADLDAMAYLRRNTPPDVLVLNYPLGTEGHWVPVIAERQSVAFRDQPFFAGAEPYVERGKALADAYFDLARPGTRDLLNRYGVTYVIIPQALNEPETFGNMAKIIRWRSPDADKWRSFVSSPADAPWLELVFDQDGAQVYRVLTED